MHSLHLQRFTNLFQELENWANGGDMSEVPSNLRDMVTKYDSSLEETLNGKMSKTVQFCKIYAYIAGLIQLMQHAVRIYGTELYSFALFEVTSIFFMANNCNYARWIFLYSLDLANLEKRLPDFKKVLTERGLSVNRTGKSFAGVPVEMAPEKTINANAKIQLKDIMAFEDISTAVTRWIMAASMKSKILYSVLDYADMKIFNDELKKLGGSLQ